MSEEKKNKRPAHIPPENVYIGVHWAIYLSYFIAFITLYLLISEAFFG